MDIGKVLVRIGVAFAFLYPPIDAFFHPYTWTDFFPSFIATALPIMDLLWIWGVVQVLIGLWILSGKHIFVPSVFAALILCAIVFFNSNVFDIVFRDIAIALAAAALALWSYRGRQA